MLRQKDELLEKMEERGKEAHAQQDLDQLQIQLMKEKQARVTERTQYVDDLEALSDYVDDLEAELGISSSRKREVARRV